MADYTLSAELSLKDKFSAKIKAIGKEFEKFQEKIQKFYKKMGSGSFMEWFGKGVKKSVNIGITALNKYGNKIKELLGKTKDFGKKIGENILKAGVVVTGAGVYGIKAAGDFEALGARMNTAFGGNKKIAADYFKWANNFANVTPYSNEEIIDAAVKLKSYGYDPKRMMTMLGDWAAAYGKPLDQAVEAFADAGQGEYERIKELGINKNKILKYAEDKGDAIAVSGERILDPQKFMDTLQEMIINQSKDGMSNLSKTLTGMLSTTAGLLKFNIAKLFGYTEDNKIRTGSLLDRIKQKFEKFNTWMQSKDGQATIDNWIKAFDRALPQVIELVNTIKDKFKELAGENFIEKLNKTIKEFEPSKINDWLDNLMLKFDKLTKKATRFVGLYVGMQVGSAFGVKGIVAGGLLGYFSPEVAGAIQKLAKGEEEEEEEEEKNKKTREEAIKNWYDWQKKTGGLATQATSTYAPMQQIIEEQKIKKNQEFHNFLWQDYSAKELKVDLNEKIKEKNDAQNIWNYNTDNKKLYNNTYNSENQNSSFDNSQSFISKDDYRKYDFRKSIENIEEASNLFNESKSFSSNIENVSNNTEEKTTNVTWDERSQSFISNTNNKNTDILNETKDYNSINNTDQSSNIKNENYTTNKSAYNNASESSNTSNTIAFNKDIKVAVNIDFKGSHLTMENYEEKINRAVETSVKNSFNRLINEMSNNFNFGGALV